MMNGFKIFLINLLILLIYHSEPQSACEIGIIHIDKGVWINKDTILSNCEKCYANDKVEMQKCKDIYLQHGYQNAETYQKLLAKARIDIPKLIQSIKKEKAPVQISYYFPSKYSLSSIPADSLNKILTVTPKNLDTMNGYKLEEIKSLLNEIREKIKLYKMLQVLINSKTPQLTIPDIKIDNETYQSIIYYHEFKRKSPIELFLAYFNFFRIMKGSMDYEIFRDKVRENEILAIAFSIQENLWYDASFQLPPVKPIDVMAYIDSLSSLSKESLDIIFGWNYLFTQIVSPIEKHLLSNYQKIMKNRISDIDKNDGRAQFTKLFPYESMRKYIALIEIYHRDKPQTVTIKGMSVNLYDNETYKTIKDFY